MSTSEPNDMMRSSIPWSRRLCKKARSIRGPLPAQSKARRCAPEDPAIESGLVRLQLLAALRRVVQRIVQVHAGQRAVEVEHHERSGRPSACRVRVRSVSPSAGPRSAATLGSALASRDTAALVHPGGRHNARLHGAHGQAAPGGAGEQLSRARAHTLLAERGALPRRLCTPKAARSKLRQKRH
eukprot:scaffold1130_cov195-Pinguiococcus_pyrenoidosus.AAC.12